MHLLSAFYGAAIASGAADIIVPAVQDQAMPTQNSRIFPPSNRQLLSAFGGGTALALLKLDSASLLLNGRPLIYPLDSGTAGGSQPGYIDYGDRGITLPGREQIGLLASRAVATAADVYGFLWHTERFAPAPVAPTKTIHATSAVAFANGTWTLGNITFDTALSEGRWMVIGMACDGANLLGARLVFPGSPERPGVLATTAVSEYVYPNWRMGKAGVYGTFQNYNPPQVEMLGTGTGSTQNIYLDLIKVA